MLITQAMIANMMYHSIVKKNLFIQVVKFHAQLRRWEDKFSSLPKPPIVPVLHRDGNRDSPVGIETKHGESFKCGNVF